jgi:hypothetical protein
LCSFCKVSQFESHNNCSLVQVAAGGSAESLKQQQQQQQSSSMPSSSNTPRGTDSPRRDNASSAKAAADATSGATTTTSSRLGARSLLLRVLFVGGSRTIAVSVDQTVLQVPLLCCRFGFFNGGL